MRGYNKVIILGNLTRDPDVRYTVNKRVYARFNVAVNYRYKDSNGEYKDGVDYVPVVVWGTTAENVGKYLKKGSGVFVEGRIQTSSYDAKDGSGKRYSTDVLADNVQFIGSGQQSQNQNNNNNSVDYVPTDEDFGKSIGESGFGSFSGGFTSTPMNASSDSQDEKDIPF